MENIQTKKIFIGGLLIIFALGAFVFTYQYLKTTRNPSPDSDMHRAAPANRNDLKQKNPDFAQGEIYFNDKQFDLAAESYKKAWATASSDSERESIEYRIALATYRSGKVAEGFDLFKKVVATPQYSGNVKAYAIEFMAQEQLTKEDQMLFDEIFKDQPYLEMTKNTDTLGAMRRLLNYGSSFYKFSPTTQMWLADFAANDLIRAKQGNASSEQIDAMRKEIETRFSNANEGAARFVSTNSPNAYLLATVYLIQGNVLSNLSIHNEDSFGDPLEAYSRAAQYADFYKVPGIHGFVFLNRASFNARKYGQEKASEVRNDLTSLMNGQQTERLTSLLRNSRAIDARRHSELATLANIDTGFRNRLIELGWTESDFQ